MAGSGFWTPTGTGGSGSSGAWELAYDGDGTLTGWTTVSGTWSAASGTISQTVDSASYKFLRTTAQVWASGFVLEADVRVVSATGAAYVGLLRWNGASSLGGVSGRLWDDGGQNVDLLANASNVTSASNPWSRNTWYTLRFEWTGAFGVLFVDGVGKLAAFHQPSNSTAGYLGLLNYGKPADFRNIKFWTLAHPS